MRIGWASCDVTPDRPVILKGQFHARISRYVNDPVLATALALEGGNDIGLPGHAIMVSCDRLEIPAGITERCREALSSELDDFEPTCLFVSATHTHTGPEATEGHWPEQGPQVMRPGEYADLLVGGIVQAAVQAWQSRKSGKLGWARGQAVVGHNRRMTYLDGSGRMYGDTNDPAFSHIEGYEDHGVDLLYSWDEQGNLTGVVANLACPSQVTESEYYVSADFWHEAREAIRERLGPGVFILPQCSAAGDQSPHLLLHKASEARMLQLKGRSEREEIGCRIADALCEALPWALADARDEVPVAHLRREVGLPRRMVTKQEAEQAREQLRALPDLPAEDALQASHDFTVRRAAESVLQRYQSQQEEPRFTVELHVVRVGYVVFATNPFELFLDFGIRMKARSRAQQTFLIQLCGSGRQGWAGYLPTARAIAGGSYGAGVADSEVGPEGGQALVEETVQAIGQLWGEPAE